MSIISKMVRSPFLSPIHSPLTLALVLDPILQHCVIYEIDKDGQKTLFRHFLLLPNGTIIEVFEQFKITLAPQVTD